MPLMLPPCQDGLNVAPSLELLCHKLVWIFCGLQVDALKKMRMRMCVHEEAHTFIQIAND